MSKVHEKENQTLCLDFKPDGTQYATGGKDRTVNLYRKTSNFVRLEYMMKKLNLKLVNCFPECGTALVTPTESSLLNTTQKILMS